MLEVIILMLLFLPALVIGVWLLVSQSEIAAELRGIIIKLLSIINLLGMIYLIRIYWNLLPGVSLGLGAFAAWTIWAVWIRRQDKPYIPPSSTSSTSLSSRLGDLSSSETRKPKPIPTQLRQSTPTPQPRPAPQSAPTPEEPPLPFDEI